MQSYGRRGSPGVTSHIPESVRKCEGVNPHTPKATPTLGVVALDESYNFVSHRTSIRGQLAKLWGSKVIGVAIGVISGLPFGSLEREKPFGCGPSGEVQSILEGGRWWFPPSSGHGESCVFVLPVARPSTKKCSNYALTTLCGFCASSCE